MQGTPTDPPGETVFTLPRQSAMDRDQRVNFSPRAEEESQAWPAPENYPVAMGRCESGTQQVYARLENNGKNVFGAITKLVEPPGDFIHQETKIQRRPNPGHARKQQGKRRLDQKTKVPRQPNPAHPLKQQGKRRLDQETKVPRQPNPAHPLKQEGKRHLDQETKAQRQPSPAKSVKRSLQEDTKSQPAKRQCKSPLLDHPALIEHWTPSPQELEKLQDIMKKWQVPILSVEQADAMLGNEPVLLGKGMYGVAYLTSRTNAVVKFSFDYIAYEDALAEAQAMTALKAVPGVQRLVGVCPERAMIATAYAGPILYDWLCKADALLPEEWIAIAIKVAEVIRAIHAKGIIHNDIKNDNICVNKTPRGVEVTVIDFGMSKREGQRLCFVGTWTRHSHYPPEFFRPQGGKCSSLSDVYSVGKVLQHISRCVKLRTTSILEWYRDSQSEEATSRNVLDPLLEALRSRATLAG